MIDSEGYRANVGIIIVNNQQEVFLAKRIGQSSWQFPQGGIDEGEHPEQAMYRELQEEVGLLPDDIAILARTQDWLRYRIPENFIRHKSFPKCIGQKQIWFLLNLLSSEDKINLNASEIPEFDEWKWVDKTYPIGQVIEFKQAVYKQAINELFKDLSE